MRKVFVIVLVLTTVSALTAPTVAPVYAFEKSFEEYSKKNAEEAAKQHEAEEAQHKREAEEKQAREGAEAKQREERSRHEEEAQRNQQSEREHQENEAREAEQAGKETTILHCVVPSLVGDSVRRASATLRNAHCRLGKVATAHGARGHLVVVAQSVKAHATRTAGAAVNVTLGLPKKRK